jgi:hypothetical protein
MWKQLAWIFGRTGESTSAQAEYEPVYGLPRRAVEEWLARNPQLREEYEVQQRLVHNPTLRQEYEAAQRERILALGAGIYPELPGATPSGPAPRSVER